MNIELRVPVFKDGKFDHFNFHKLEVFGKSYSFGNCHFMGNYELKEPELFSGLKGYQGDIVDVCIFLVSPENPDNDQHFRGVLEFENGKFVFVIHKYLKFDGNKSEWIDIRSKDLPFYDEELDEDGTYSVTYFDFLAMSSNMGEFCDDNVEIVGNIYENHELLGTKKAKLSELNAEQKRAVWQGRNIAPYVSRLCAGGDLEHESFKLALKPNRITAVDVSNSAPLAQNRCQPQCFLGVQNVKLKTNKNEQ